MAAAVTCATAAVGSPAFMTDPHVQELVLCVCPFVVLEAVFAWNAANLLYGVGRRYSF